MTSFSRWMRISAVAGVLAPSPARALEVMPSASVYVGWSFGAEPGINWGVNLRSFLLVQGNKYCSNLGPTPIGVGAVLGVGMRGLQAPRLNAGLAGGFDPFGSWDALKAAHIEAGAAIPLGDLGETSLQGALVASTTLSHVFLQTTPGMGETATVGLGATVPGMLYMPGYCIIGRPTRNQAGEREQAWSSAAETTDAQAAAWHEDARMEAEAVGAFLLLARELMALGAPEALIHAALDAAEEELLHTQMAAARAGRVQLRPPALPRRHFSSRDDALARLAVEGFLDGAINEGAAADEAQQASRAAVDPSLARHYQRLAHDERRHAILGRAVVRWALAAGGEPVRHALQQQAPVRFVPEQEDRPEHVPQRVVQELGQRRAAHEQRWLQALLAS